MLTKGWLVVDAVKMPARPIAWFPDEAEARSYAADRNGVVRRMDAQIAPNPHAPQSAEASL